MSDINDEYFLLIKNHEELNKGDEFIFLSPTMETLRNKEALYDDTWDGRPVEFRLDAVDMDKPHRHKEKLDDDFILSPTMGLIIADRHREFFMTEGRQTDFNFHQAIITFPEEAQKNKLFEGFWLIPKPYRDIAWMDLERSLIRYDRKNPKEIDTFRSYALSQHLKDIDLKERLMFVVETPPGSIFFPIVHKRIADYIMSFNPKQVRCATLAEIAEDPSLKYQ